MGDEGKTKRQLINELRAMRETVDQLKVRLKETEERCHLFFDRSCFPSFILSMDDGRVLDANSSAVEIAGYSSREEFLNGFVTGIDNADPEIIKNLFSVLVSGGKVERREFRFVKKDGQTLWVEFNARGYSPRGWLIVEEVDITRRKELEGALLKSREELQWRVEEATRDLRETKEFLENVFHASMDGIMVTDAHGMITMVNDSLTELVGYSRDELVGMSSMKLNPAGRDSEKSGRKFVEQLFRDGYLHEKKQKWEKKDGSSLVVEISAALLRDGQGNCVGIVGSVKDVTRRVEIERTLLEREAKYRELVQCANSIILRMDCKGNVTFFNEFAQNFFGYTEEEILGRSVIGTIVPERDSTGRDLQIMIEEIGRHTERYRNNENENIRRNGERVWISWTNRAILDEGGGIREILCVGNDITERKRSEEELSITKNFLEKVIESSLDSIVITDLNGCIVRTNEAFLRLLGYHDQEEVVGRHMSEFAPGVMGSYPSSTGLTVNVGADFIGEVRGWMSRLIKDGTISGMESYHLRSDGTVIPVEDTLGYIYNSAGERTGVVGIIRDITSRKQTERQLLRYQEDLRSLASEVTALEEKDRRKFATYIHDKIGQSLFAAKIKLNALREEIPHPAVRISLDEIEAIIEEVISGSRSLTFDMSPPVLYQLGLEAALESLVEKVNGEGDLVVRLKAESDGTFLKDDVRIFLFRAIQELLRNIKKHAEARNVEISLRRVQDQLLVGVRDDGVGFNSHDLDSPVEEMQRFGLFSIRERLIHFGGTFSLRSDPDQGTCVTLTLPHEGKDLQE